MSNFSFRLDEDKIAKIKETFKEYIRPNSNEYVDTFIQKDDLTITIYRTRKVVFQGNDAFFYASAYLDPVKKRQAGSDEVGTGDAFGPIVVCAAIVEEEDYPYIEENHITDSKQLTDVYIRKIGKELMEKFKHSLLILDNEKYNQVHLNNNLNAIKAKMHNKAYLNMLKKGYNIPAAAYVDQFCGVDDYFHYLFDEPEIYHGLIFETKAEEKYPAVAIGSIISRYAFLLQMDQMEKRFNMVFPKGSSDTEQIAKTAETFVNRYGKDRLAQVAKLHFKNFDSFR